MLIERGTLEEFIEDIINLSENLLVVSDQNNVLGIVLIFDTGSVC